MSINEYLNAQDEARRSLMHHIHDVILEKDATVVPVIGDMMGKTMILYNDRGSFKYGLASVKDYMSLHVLPIYMNAPLHQKYEGLLSTAKFQKGCINFKSAEEMPVEIAARLIEDCAPIDLIKIREEYLAAKKKKK